MPLADDGEDGAVLCLQAAERARHMVVPLVEEHPLDRREVAGEFIEIGILVLIELVELPFDL
ncbi:MAG: hypothetical protein AABY19_03910, partial [Candidatus Thermoplasmatota archaeon]